MNAATFVRIDLLPFDSLHIISFLQLKRPIIEARLLWSHVDLPRPILRAGTTEHVRDKENPRQLRDLDMGTGHASSNPTEDLLNCSVLPPHQRVIQAGDGNKARQFLDPLDPRNHIDILGQENITHRRL